MHLSKPILVALLLASAPVWAQSAGAPSAGVQQAPGNFTYSAAKLTYRDGGIRLDGTSEKPGAR